MPAKGGEVQELIGHIRKAGYKATRSGSQRHYKVLDPKGRVVTDANGPLIISTSPSDNRWREMHVQRLMRAGVLKADPYKATGKQSRGPQDEAAAESGGNGDGKKKGAHLQSEEVKERARRAAARVRDSRSHTAVEETAKLRARFEPIVSHLGGWAQGAGPRAHLSLTDLRVLTVGELAAVMQSWALSRGRMELPRDKITKQPADAKQVEAAARGLRAGSTISEKWRPLVDVFLDDLWRDAGADPRKAAARYLHLLREQRGIVEPPETPAAGERAPLIPLRPDPTPTPEPEMKLGPAYDLRPPELAIAVAYWAGKGGATEAEAAELATKVAEMEFNKQKEEVWHKSRKSGPDSSVSDPTPLTRTTY